MLKAKVFSPFKKSVNRLLVCLDPLAKKSVITGKATFNQFATNLGHSELKSISRQAVWKRMDLSTIPFLLDTVGTALKQRWSEEALIATNVFGREIGKDLVDLIRENDLVLRDIGYFSRDEFARIENRKAYWLSRVPINVKVHDLN